MAAAAPTCVLIYRDDLGQEKKKAEENFARTPLPLWQNWVRWPPRTDDLHGRVGSRGSLRPICGFNRGLVFPEADGYEEERG